MTLLEQEEENGTHGMWWDVNSLAMWGFNLSKMSIFLKIFKKKVSLDMED